MKAPKQVNVHEAKKKLRLGTWKGRIWMSPDFDAPLSEEELKGWGY